MRSQICAFAVLGFALSQSATAATLTPANADSVTKLQQQTNIHSLSTTNSTPQKSLSKARQAVDKNGNQHTVWTQHYQGIPIYGKNISQHAAKTAMKVGLSLKTQNDNSHWQGQLVNGLHKDIQSTAPRYSQEEAIQFVKTLAADKQAHYERETAKLFIFLDANQQGHLAYRVSFFKDSKQGGAPERPVYFLDAGAPLNKTSSILDHYESLTHEDILATGPGGNTKTGQYTYGEDNNPYLKATRTHNGCVLENESVKTLNLNHMFNDAGKEGDAIQLNCTNTNFADSPSLAEDIDNGAYSPANDAHAFGSIIVDMYKNWYQVNALEDASGNPIPLVMRVHYGNKYENAFWNGESMTFGDGDTFFYPLVSLDVAGHEVSHGFTEQHSGLEYRNVTGALNEAFSDMAGKTADYYRSQETGNNSFSWALGGDIVKEGDALRYLDTPEKDGVSIGNAADWPTLVTKANEWADENFQNPQSYIVHHGSGIFNHAFYLLATREGWNPKLAFEVMIQANRFYWNSFTHEAAMDTDSANQNLSQAAVDVILASQDLYPNDKTKVADVVSAFKGVGITCTTNGKAPSCEV